jgi:hypothetical protein
VLMGPVAEARPPGHGHGTAAVGMKQTDGRRQVAAVLLVASRDAAAHVRDRSWPSQPPSTHAHRQHTAECCAIRRLPQDGSETMSSSLRPAMSGTGLLWSVIAVSAVVGIGRSSGVFRPQGHRVSSGDLDTGVGHVCSSDDRDGVLPGRLLFLNLDRGSTEECEAVGPVDSGRLGVAGRGPDGAAREVLASEDSGFATTAAHSLAREASCVPSRAVTTSPAASMSA